MGRVKKRLRSHRRAVDATSFRLSSEKLEPGYYRIEAIAGWKRDGEDGVEVHHGYLHLLLEDGRLDVIDADTFIRNSNVTVIDARGLP